MNIVDTHDQPRASRNAVPTHCGIGEHAARPHNWRSRVKAHRLLEHLLGIGQLRQIGYRGRAALQYGINFGL